MRAAELLFSSKREEVWIGIPVGEAFYFARGQFNESGKVGLNIREEILDAQITELLKPHSLRADWVDAMLKLFKEEKKAGRAIPRATGSAEARRN